MTEITLYAQPTGSEPPAKEKTDTAPQPEARTWNISEADIPDEEYFDQVDKRRKRFINHKNPQDLFTSYINAQKKLHYETEVRLPQLQSDFNAERSRLQGEIEELKKQVSDGKPPEEKPDSSAKPDVPPIPQMKVPTVRRSRIPPPAPTATTRASRSTTSVRRSPTTMPLESP